MGSDVDLQMRLFGVGFVAVLERAGKAPGALFGSNTSCCILNRLLYTGAGAVDLSLGNTTCAAATAAGTAAFAGTAANCSCRRSKSTTSDRNIRASCSTGRGHGRSGCAGIVWNTRTKTTCTRKKNRRWQQMST